MSITTLYNVPKNDADWSIWSFAHKDSHIRICQAIQAQTGNITSVTLTNGGSGYTSIPGIVLGNTGSGAEFSVTIEGGVITSLTLTSGGTGYTTTFIEISGGGGTGATATITIDPVVNLTQYQIDPIPFFAIKQWLENNQQFHDDMNGELGLQGSDLEDTDLSDPKRLQGWIWSHVLEHVAAEQQLGIGG